MRDTDEVHGCLAEDQSVDSTSNVLGSILMSVNLSNKVKSSKLKHYDIGRAYFQERWRSSFTSDRSVCRTQRRTSKDEHGTVEKCIQRIIAPQSKSRRDNDSARRQGVHQDGDYKTHNAGLIRRLQNQDNTGLIGPKTESDFEED